MSKLHTRCVPEEAENKSDKFKTELLRSFTGYQGTRGAFIDTYGIESDSSLVHQTDYAIDSTTLGNIVPTGSLLNTFGVALLAA